MKKKLTSLGAVLFWLLVWQGASMALHQTILLCSPLQALEALGQMLPQGSFWASVMYSLGHIALGFGSSLTLGVVLAVLAFRFGLVKQLLAPLMLTVRTVPVASFIILVLIWFPSKWLSVIISALMVLPIVYGHVLQGLNAADPQLLEMAQVFRMGPWRRFRLIRFQALVPYMKEGLTLALGLCWKAGIAAEVIGIPRGSIGEKLYQSKIYLETPQLFAWTFVIVLLSVGFERLVLLAFSLLDKRMREV